MPAAAIEEARESVLGVSLEYDPVQPLSSALFKSLFPICFDASVCRYRELEQPKAQGGSARLAPLARDIHLDVFGVGTSAPLAAAHDSAGVIILPVQRALPTKCSPSGCAAHDVRLMWHMQRVVPRINLGIKP